MRTKADMTTRNPILWLAATVVMAIAAASRLSADPSGGKFYSIDDPGAEGGTFARSINNNSEVLGSFIDVHHAPNYFRFGYGFYKTFDFPYAGQSAANRSSWNKKEQIVGTYRDPQGRFHGFFLSGRKSISLDFPGAAVTFASSLNDKGQIAGIYSDLHGTKHAFTYIGGKYANIDPKGMGPLTMRSVFINNLGHIAGSYENASGKHTYLSVNGVNLALGSPKFHADFVATGLNDKDEVVGHCLSGAPNGAAPCFLWSRGVYKPVTLPGVRRPMFAQGINNQRQIVGFYIDDNGEAHGFLLVP